ncbi:hypothetical protein PVAND_012435 [Polypedilum vanderplanki]|uniref:BTB domain-containing protein n=1 Tax=Polypedilum vanderplanki TaxID=319348 RepID=A0A9J6CMP5_POLVA|nr:hypothetical protein PVAND_012435 [Polypedilum vanderplanki]
MDSSSECSDVCCECGCICNCSDLKNIKKKSIIEEFTIYRKIKLKIEKFSKLKEASERVMDNENYVYYNEKTLEKNFIMPTCIHRQFTIIIGVNCNFCELFLYTNGPDKRTSLPDLKDLNTCICQFENINYESPCYGFPDCIEDAECEVISDNNKTFVQYEDSPDQELIWNLKNIEKSEEIHCTIKFVCNFDIKRNIIILYEDFLGKDLFNDISLICADNITVRANSIILSKYSSVFKVMLEGNMKEAETKEIKIDDIDSITMQQLINFLYAGKINKNEDMLESVLYAAEKYDIQNLKSICLYQLHKKLSIETVWNTLKIADMYNAELLFFECIGFLFYSFSEVEDEEGYKNLNQRLKEKIIAQKKSVVKDLTLTYEEENRIDQVDSSDSDI